MAYFTDFQDYFFLCSDISSEGKRKLNGCVIIGIGIRTAGFKHKIIGVVECQAVDEHVSSLVAVAIKTLDGRSDVAPECHAAVCIVNTLAAAARSVAA